MKRVIMNCYGLIVGFFAVHACQAMDNVQILKKLSQDKILQPIDKKDLPGLLGKKVHIKIRDAGYIDGFLGNKVSDSSAYYQVYYDKQCTKGDSYLSEQLCYIRNNDQQ